MKRTARNKHAEICGIVLYGIIENWCGSWQGEAGERADRVLVRVWGPAWGEGCSVSTSASASSTSGLIWAFDSTPSPRTLTGPPATAAEVSSQLTYDERRICVLI